MCSNSNSSHLEDWTVETQLVHDFTRSADEALPTRSELDHFVAKSVVHTMLSILLQMQIVTINLSHKFIYLSNQ